MKEINSNINIIGGGLIGSITAYSLSKLGFKVSILEKNPTHNKKRVIDQRTTAISEGTRNFLATIGLWNDITNFCEPIKQIKVIDRNLTNKLEFDNNRRNSNLGYIIKNKDLLNIVYSKLRKKKNVKIFNNININDFQINNDFIITNSSNLRIVADLNIAADGKNSFVKNFFKTPYYSKDYNKKALVLIIAHTNNHNGTAFEFFYKNGPLAILPMKKNDGNFCSSIVWTNNSNYVDQLDYLDSDKLITILNKETKNCVGNIKKIISKQTFPLSAHINSNFYEKKTIYIGDSAHSFHPIAGQGWNLGISDVKNLLKLVENYKLYGLDLGSVSFCKKYHQDNFYNAYRLYHITDKLDVFFKLQNPFISFGRFSGINFINNNRKIKNIISDFAMGIN